MNVLEAESLTLMYMSDQPRLSGESVALAVASLANTEGGLIYLGVEPDGSISGIHSNRMDWEQLPEEIVRHTHPAIAVRVTPLKLQHRCVLQLEVPHSLSIVATSAGAISCRRETLQGAFVNLPLLPYDFASRVAANGIVDMTAQPVAEAGSDDMLDLERARIRQAAARFGGSHELQTLSNEELDRTLHLTTSYQNRRVPTVAGLILTGTPEAIMRHIPAHEMTLIDSRDVTRTKFHRLPLLQMYEQAEQFYRERVKATDVHVGSHLIRIPNLSQECLQECVVNAFMHRDYARFGSINITWNLNSVSVSSPGGFLPGTDLPRLLSSYGLTRNPVLASALMRIGLSNRTGRGMDRIYKNLLQYGRTTPSFAQSSPHKVVVELSTAPVNRPLLNRIIKVQDRLGFALPTQALLLLESLQKGKSIDLNTAARIAQCDSPQAGKLLELLEESAQPSTMPLNPKPLPEISQQEAAIMDFARKHGQIRRGDVIRLFNLNGSKATRLLQALVNQGKLQSGGLTKSTFYKPIDHSFTSQSNE